MRAGSAVVITAAVVVVLIAAGAVLFAYSGAYNVAADEPHWPGTRWLFETTMDNSIEAHSENIVVPDDLDQGKRIMRGGATYAQMCEVCHLAPGMASTPAHVGLRPEPPKLADAGEHSPEYLFWAVKHGIKMTGMPAWGLTHDDETLWDIVAFLQYLPRMNKQEYAALTKSSDEQSYPGSSGDHGHPDDHHAGDDHTHRRQAPG